MRQDDGKLSDTPGSLVLICQLIETGWRLSDSYIRQYDGYM